jgi:hypothetical protein
LKLPQKFLRLIAVLFLVFNVMFLLPSWAKADEIIVILNPETAYVDTIVEVIAPSEYIIQTFTGPRFETLADGTLAQRAGWLDSWIELRQGEQVLRADDDSNHVTGVNDYASKITGNVDIGTYTIRATSYLNRIGAGNPTGSYVLYSNLIPPPPPAIVIDPVVSPPVVEPVTPPPPPPEPPVVIPDPPPIPEPPTYEPPVVEPEPPVVEPEPPIEEPEPPVVEPEPPIPIEEPPIVIDEPPVVVEEPPVEAEEPPAVVEEPPVVQEVVQEEAPTPVEEPPLVANENSTEEEKEIIAEALIEAADGQAVTAEAIAEAGLTYADLPPETPVQVRQDENGNEVVITAEIAAALVLLENPAELVKAIFTDPAQALLALGSIGADMSPEERKESEKTIVAAIIVGGIATQSALSAAASAGTVAYRRKP